MALRGKNARQLGAYSRCCSSNQRHTIGHPTSSLVRVLVTRPCRRCSGLRGLLTAIVQFSSGALSLGRCSFEVILPRLIPFANANHTPSSGGDHLSWFP